MGYGFADLTVTERANIVAVSVVDTDTGFLMDPTREFSILDAALASDLDLELSPANLKFKQADGTEITASKTDVEKFTIGGVTRKAEFIVIDLAKISANLPNNAKGVLGSGLLNKFNALIDLGNKRLFVRSTE